MKATTSNFRPVRETRDVAPQELAWQQRLRTILAEPRYHPQTHTLSFGWFWQAVWHWLATHIFVFHLPHGRIPPVTGYAVLVVALVVTALFFRRLTVNPGVPRTPRQGVQGASRTAADWVREADGLMLQGEYVEASRLLFRAALTDFAQRGYIRLAPDKTNGDYVRAITRQRLPEEQTLRAIAADCDLLWYGAADGNAAELARRTRDRVTAVLAGGDSP